MMKVSADHLARCAVGYVRQLSVDQVVYNRESQRRRYGLAARDPRPFEVLPHPSAPSSILYTRDDDPAQRRFCASAASP